MNTELEPTIEILEAADSMGQLMEYWGFKHIHGVLWTLLYVRKEPTSQASLAKWTGYSTGAISMALNELVGWSVVHNQRVMGKRGYFYYAESDFGVMIRRVFERRELPMLNESLQSFQTAYESIKHDRLRQAEYSLQNLKVLSNLTQAFEWTIKQFINGAKLPVSRISKFLGVR